MIEAKNLSKRFWGKTVVDDISFTVNRGEVLGFLGPNAAGKSTTMRMITGFLPPTSGTAIIGGDDIIEAPLSAREKVGYLPENAPTYPDMTVIGFLDFIAEIRGFTGKEKTRRIEGVFERCFLSDVRFQTISTLSKGFKQRVCFAQSIIHDPEYLIMDEPTDGLDPNQKHEVRNMIHEMARHKAIILSTHNLEEVDAVCTRAIIIANGKIVADDTPAGLKTRSSVHGAICFTLDKKEGEQLVQDIEQIPDVDTVAILKETASKITLRVMSKDTTVTTADRIIRHFLDKGRKVEALFVEEGRLDDVFRMVTNKD
ncbi:MAG: ABC transporter ATP-binding protein [Desulfobacterales bacterium]|nr:ABC transporter ATP-binding protein [Desulfobacterales bacterium]